MNNLTNLFLFFKSNIKILSNLQLYKFNLNINSLFIKEQSILCYKLTIISNIVKLFYSFNYNIYY